MKKELVNGRPKSCTDQTQEHDAANVQKNPWIRDVSISSELQAESLESNDELQSGVLQI